MRYLLLFLFLFTINAEAATQLKKTVMPSGGDYTSLEACMNANEQNLTTADKYFDVEIDGSWSSADTSAVTIHNYTTDATRYINIYTTGAARHNGTAASGYKLDVASGNGIDNNASNVTITALIIDVADADTTGISDTTLYLTNTLYKQNIIIGDNGCSYGIYFGSQARGNHWANNNIIYNFNKLYGTGIYCGNGGDSNTHYYVDNNTVYNCYRNIDMSKSSTSTGEASNNLSMSGTNVSFVWESTTGGNNCTYDALGDDVGTGGLINYTSYSDYFVNVTAGSEDFHLKVTATNIIDGGADLSTVANVDIDGRDRDAQGDTWDIGADEYVAAGGATTSLPMENIGGGLGRGIGRGMR